MTDVDVCAYITSADRLIGTLLNHNVIPLHYKNARTAAESLRVQAVSLLSKPALQGWQPMESAPRDGKTILAWCVHAADPGFEEGGDKLTVYSAHVEGLGKHVDDGPHVLEFGGGFDDRTYEEPDAGWLPDWWFLHGSDFEDPAYPVCWMPIVVPELADVIQALRKGR